MKSSDVWKWNLEQLALRISLFNGKKIIGIVEDKQSHWHKDVLEFAASVGITFDHVVVRKNKPKLREVVTWLPMLEILSPETAGENEVVFSAHAKGVRHLSKSCAVFNWASVLYESSLDYWPITESLLEKKICAGSLMGYGAFNFQNTYGWFYAGTFFWWSLAEIGRRRWQQVDQATIGTESWIGLQCPNTEAGIIFFDMDYKPWAHEMYSEEKWREIFTPKWEEWKKLNERHYYRPGNKSIPAKVGI
jgi:hypothetical protein